MKKVREREISYHIPYMRNPERNDTNKLIYKTEIDSQTENEFMVTTRGYEWGEGIIREFGVNMYTLLYLK